MARIGLAQFNSILKDVKSNERKMVDMIKQAKEEKADIVVFPELFTTGYNLEIIQDDIKKMAQDINGSTIGLAKKTAKQQQIYVAISIAYQQDDCFYNACVIIDDGGNVLDVYKKNHLWDLEQKYFSYGDHNYKVHQTPFGKIGFLVCYDVDFPETSRALALAGADIIFVTAAWATTHRTLWDIFLPARALENTVYVAGVNRVGVEGDVVFFGDSKVFDPTGAYIAGAKENEEMLFCCDVDVEKIKEIRKGFPYLKERRAKGYGI